jgi:tyrosine-protein phosphatase SIW14
MQSQMARSKISTQGKMKRSLPIRLFHISVVSLLVLLAAHGQNAPSPSQSFAKPTNVSAPAEKLKIAGVPNAGKVSDELFRGGQPSNQGLAELKKLGITTIVNLRGNHGEIERERAQAQGLGLRYVNLPIKGWSPPSDKQVAQFLKIFQDGPGQKVFVHCYFGEDRTSVMVATYRIAQQRWTPGQAISEMDSFGFHYYLYRSMKTYVRRFPSNFATEPVFAPVRLQIQQSQPAQQPH